MSTPRNQTTDQSTTKTLQEIFVQSLLDVKNSPSHSGQAKKVIMPDRFIAVNILPPRDDIPGQDALKLYKKQIEDAADHGFNHVWINPVCYVSANSACTRLCLDTGVNTTFYQSLYAPDDPLKVRAFFSENIAAIRELNLTMKNKHNLHVLVDFVWKHVNKHSPLISSHPTWFGKESKELKDIREYDFSSPNAKEILKHLEEVIILYLDPVKGFGFSGLRVDAASQLTPMVRSSLYKFARDNFPDAIIFEEVLFDRAQQTEIRALTESAIRDQVFSHYVTSNIYYQKPDIYGALPEPDKMGDAEKLKLANNNAIGFTGNHDHYSAGWCVIMMMAAERAFADKEFMTAIGSLKVAPSSNDKLHVDHIVLTIGQLAERVKIVEELSAFEGPCLRYLLPFANEIINELLNFSRHEKTLARFKHILFEKITNKTLSSPSGYFVLYSELLSFFENQRIFTNMKGGKLQQIILTPEDFIQQMDVTLELLKRMEEETEPEPLDEAQSAVTQGSQQNKSRLKKQMVEPRKVGKAKAGSKKYDNLANFEKNNSIRKKNLSHQDLIRNMRVWHPYLIEFLMNHPEHLNLYKRYSNPTSITQACTALLDAIKLPQFMREKNQIFAGLTTIACSNYHTFTSLDEIKIVVRTTGTHTDIILVNLNPDNRHSIEDIDIEKIALWHQARLCPVAQHMGSALSSPCDKKQLTYYQESYSSAAKSLYGEKFDDSYLCVTGGKLNHTTSLHLGHGFNVNLENKQIRIVTHLKSERQVENDIFESKNKKFPAPSSSTLFATNISTTDQVSSPGATLKSPSS